MAAISLSESIQLTLDELVPCYHQVRTRLKYHRICFIFSEPHKRLIKNSVLEKNLESLENNLEKNKAKLKRKQNVTEINL